MNTSSEYKIFWDAVHGQINVSKKICRNILDTEHFQRLKRLEQTNARPLYPCAHHDRFIHSLGTFHLGALTFESVMRNSDDYIKNIVKTKNRPDIEWAKLKNEFNLACLLHDVGHAPFSHTFEDFYKIDLKLLKNEILDDLLLNKKVSEDYPSIEFSNIELNLFIEDYTLAIQGSSYNNHGNNYKIGSNPKNHEKVSAFLVLTIFRDTLINAFGVNPIVIARMILGIKFSKGFHSNELQYQIYNCLVELLNGEEIDVDKIDYLIRDQWATGNVFRKIDYIKLLSSIYIRIDEDTNLLINYFHKKTINEIIAIKETKNNIAVNIHSHPIVKYDDFVLKKAVNESIRLEIGTSDEIKDNQISNIVNVKALLRPVEFASSFIYLPTDDDLIHVLKKHTNSSGYAKEWISRDYRLRSLWKSPYDFNYYFSNLNSHEKKVLFLTIEDITKRYLKTNIELIDKFSPEEIEQDKCFYLQKTELKEHGIYHFDSNIRILINDGIQLKTEKLLKLLNREKSKIESDTSRYFILYLPSSFVNKILDEIKETKRNEFIDYAIKEVKFYVKLENEITNIINKEDTKISFNKIYDTIKIDDGIVDSIYLNEILISILAQLVGIKRIRSTSKDIVNGEFSPIETVTSEISSCPTVDILLPSS